MKCFWFSFHSNDSYAFEAGDTARRCCKCGSLLDKWSEPLDGLRIRKRNMDVSCTVDSVKIVSNKFRECCEQFQLMGLEFYQLPNDPDFFAIQPMKVVVFDVERRQTRYRDQCDTCGKFRAVVGATPAYLKPGTEILANEFVRTDVEFGSGDRKSPLILFGTVVAKRLTTAQLRGLDIVLNKPVDQ